MATDLRTFLHQRSELLLVIIILIVVAAVFHWIPFSYKIAFLNFFYLPVLAAAYLWGGRRAMLTAVLCVLLVLLYYFWNWSAGTLASGQGLEELPTVALAHRQTLLNLAMWAGFLAVTGGALGRVHEKMMEAFLRSRVLNEELQRQAGELRDINQALQASAAKLKKQTEDLQEKNLLIEQLKQQVEQTLYSTMDSSVARLMLQRRLREEKRNISVVFCDLKGFTGYAHGNQPEVILEDLNDFYGVMEDVIESYHGHIDKYLGDGIMCEFGAPVDYEQHCLQAVVAGLKMQEKFKALMQEKFKDSRPPWELRVGVASGESIVGLLGSRRRTYSAIGDVVNVAKRLEELCEPGSVFIDETSYLAMQPLLEARHVRSLAGRRAEDRQTMEAIAEKERQLERDPDNPELLFYLGLLHFRLLEATKALAYFRRAMELKPDDNEIKVAYANASVKRDEYEKIAIRGIEEKRAVFEALRLVDPLVNRQRFPQKFYDRYHHVQKLIEIPDDVTLPNEVIDASVGHSLSVAVVAYALGDALGVADELKRDLLAAAPLQDLGKSVIFHHVLNRRGGLSDQERKDLEAHVPESVVIAKRVGYDRPGVIDIIANHHELLNGEGYPRRIKGEQIPVGGRISCVADIYCALTSWRPYREAWDSRIALSELRKGTVAGKYDSKVVDALLELVG